MRCDQARRILERKASMEIDLDDERKLKEHQNVCPACAGLEDQLERTWHALEEIKPMEPSPDFLPRFRARLRDEEDRGTQGFPWQKGPGWRWIALAACILLAAVLLTRTGLVRHGTSLAPQVSDTSHDRDGWDERFLQDLDQALQHADLDYLATYDSWPETVPEAKSVAPADVRPGYHVKKKEIS
jgi:hypothetical protein